MTEVKTPPQQVPIPMQVVGESVEHSLDPEVEKAGVQIRHDTAELQSLARKSPVVDGEITLQLAKDAVPHHIEPEGTVTIQEKSPPAITRRSTYAKQASSSFGIGLLSAAKNAIFPSDESIVDKFEHRLKELRPKEEMKHAA